MNTARDNGATLRGFPSSFSSRLLFFSSRKLYSPRYEAPTHVPPTLRKALRKYRNYRRCPVSAFFAFRRSRPLGNCSVGNETVSRACSNRSEQFTDNDPISRSSKIHLFNASAGKLPSTYHQRRYFFPSTRGRCNSSGIPPSARRIARGRFTAKSKIPVTHDRTSSSRLNCRKTRLASISGQKS